MVRLIIHAKRKLNYKWKKYNRHLDSLENLFLINYTHQKVRENLPKTTSKIMCLHLNSLQISHREEKKQPEKKLQFQEETMWPYLKLYPEMSC